MGRLDVIEALSGHKGRVWNISWHPKGSVFASCGEDKTIRIWGKDGNKWALKTVLTDGHQRTIREVSWSPCGSYLASASFDATTAIWDNKIGEFECNATLEGHENEVKSVSWSQSGQHLATCSRDKSVWVWEVAGDDEYVCAAVLNAHTQDVKKVIWHPNIDLLASCSYDNTIKVFKEDPSDNDWYCSSTLQSHTSTVWSISFDSSGDRLVSCSDDKTLKIWKEYKPGNSEGIATPENNPVWKCVCTLSGYHTRTIYDVAWSHLNGIIATASGDDIIRLFKEVTVEGTQNEPSFELIHSAHGAHAQDVNAVQWHPTDPTLLLSCSDDGQIKLWRFQI